MILLIESIVFCIIFSLIVIPSVIKNKVAWISDYPPAIQERARKLGIIPKEQKDRPCVFIARKIIVTLICVAILVALLIFVNGVTTFKGAFISSYILWLAVAWYDAFVIDCLWFCHSKKVRIEGTEDMDKDYKDYLFHIKASVKGSVIGLVVSLIVASLVALII